jgi:hypothetical protein
LPQGFGKEQLAHATPLPGLSEQHSNFAAEQVIG